MKRVIKIIAKTILVFIVLVLAYLLFSYCLSRITIHQEENTKEEITIYILTNGVHTDLVVPVKSILYDWSSHVQYCNTVSKDSNYQYLAMGWGNKGFYLETPEWKDLKASVAFKAAFGLSATAIHATYYKKMEEGERCRKIKISLQQYQQLIQYITNSFQQDKEGHFMPIVTNAVYGKDDAFYEATGHYSLLYTCNTWANQGLKKSGQKCCLWTPFDTGIFIKY